MSMNKNELIENNMKLVHYVINKYYPTYSYNEDVIQEGMVGLCYAAEKYDESKSKFSTFANKCILNNIRTYFKRTAKHDNHLSLDYEVTTDLGTMTFGETIMGVEDVDLSNLKYYEFYESVDYGDRYILDNIAYSTTTEIGEALGISQQAVSQRLRRLRLKWRNNYETDKD